MTICYMKIFDFKLKQCYFGKEKTFKYLDQRGLEEAFLTQLVPPLPKGNGSTV